MKSGLNPAEIKALRKHMLLYCITDLKSACVINKLLKKQYPNLERVRLTSQIAWDKVVLEMTHLKTRAERLKATGGVDCYKPVSGTMKWDS